MGIGSRYPESHLDTSACTTTSHFIPSSAALYCSSASYIILPRFLPELTP